ncbi:MAG: hypothetical protein RIG68_12295 [Imperialibacter sp.]|uniref:hypothetical protein n=1 Tax=Imperialibacter sp. TaxID=2038411 RepID=UPI0032EAF076
MHNLTAYLRFISRRKTLSFIYVFGLAIGFAACIFIGLYIIEEPLLVRAFGSYPVKLNQSPIVLSLVARDFVRVSFANRPSHQRLLLLPSSAARMGWVDFSKKGCIETLSVS